MPRFGVSQVSFSCGFLDVHNFVVSNQVEISPSKGGDRLDFYLIELFWCMDAAKKYVEF